MLSVPLLSFFSLLSLSYIPCATATSLSSSNILGSLISRQLLAASRGGLLSRRGRDFALENTVELAYAEDRNTNGVESVFASTVKFHSNRPILAIEEYEHSITNVQCSSDKIDLHFSSLAATIEALRAWERLNDATVITSHKGCNERGERAVFDLHDVELLEAGVVRLWTNRTSWRHSVISMSVDFGHTTEKHRLRQHDSLVRRDSTQTVTVTASNSQTATTTQTVVSTQVRIISSGQSWASASSLPNKLNFTIPNALAPFPSATPLHFNLSSQKLNQNIELPVLPPPALPLNVSIGCKNCTTSGSLDLSAGMFVVQPNNIVGMADVIQNGSVLLSMADGFQAYMELGANISAAGAFEVPLFEVPVQGFTINGIGRAGLTFSTSISAEFNMSESMQVGFGFDVKVPRSSSVFIDLANMTNSSITGFEKTSLNSLPFSINGSVTGTMLATLKPRIPLGFEFFDGELTAQVGVFLEAPALAMNLTKQKAGTNTTSLTCRPDENNVTTILSQELRLGVGLEAELSFDFAKLGPELQDGQLLALSALAGGGLLQTATYTMLLGTTIAQPSRCFGGLEPTTSSTSSNSTVITPAPTPYSTSERPAQPTAAQTITTRSAAVSNVVADICAVLLVVVAMVFISL